MPEEATKEETKEEEKVAELTVTWHSTRTSTLKNLVVSDAFIIDGLEATMIGPPAEYDVFCDI